MNLELCKHCTTKKKIKIKEFLIAKFHQQVGGNSKQTNTILF